MAGRNRRLVAIGVFIKRHWIPIRSCLLFAATLGVWLIWYPTIVDNKALSGLLELTAQITASILGFFGTRVVVSGTVVSSAAFTMRMGHECTAIVPMVILICAVLAYPSNVKQKLIAVAIGLPILFLLNLVRTVTLYYIGALLPDFLETAHFVVWQSAMILAVVALWLLWVGKMVNVRSS